jgi:hypothetical protein
VRRDGPKATLTRLRELGFKVGIKLVFDNPDRGAASATGVKDVTIPPEGTIVLLILNARGQNIATPQTRKLIMEVAPADSEMPEGTLEVTSALRSMAEPSRVLDVVSPMPLLRSRLVVPIVLMLGAFAPAASAAVLGQTTDAAMRKGIRDVARVEVPGSTASRVAIKCGARGKVGHTAHCSGSFRLTLHGRFATYTLTSKATVFNNSPGSLQYRVDSRADHKVKGLPSRTGISGFLQ